MRFKFIDAEKDNYPMTVLCRVLHVTRSGYYAWYQRALSAHAKRDAALLQKIRQFYQASGQRYGSPRIYDDLRNDREAVGKKRVARLMRDHYLVGRHRRKFRCTTDSKHQLAVAPNLLKRRFEARQPNAVWSSDITQLWTPQGWVYLAVVLDLFSRYVVGWALRSDITRKLVIAAVTMAIDWRKPAAGLIFHSDRGSQYAAQDTKALLRTHDVVCSMSGVGNCYDNAVSESFFAALKNELGDSFPSRKQAHSDTFEFIEAYYNPYRRHSFNGNVSPRDCEAYFMQNGYRPSSVMDLVSQNFTGQRPTVLTDQVPPSHIPRRCHTPIAAVESLSREVCILPI